MRMKLILEPTDLPRADWLLELCPESHLQHLYGVHQALFFSNETWEETDEGELIRIDSNTRLKKLEALMTEIRSLERLINSGGGCTGKRVGKFNPQQYLGVYMVPDTDDEETE
jgi:hypothetical protein